VWYPEEKKFYYTTIENSSAILGKDAWCEPYVIQQFTGFTDRNGKEIYEGDIFKSGEYKWDYVEFENGRWQVHLRGARVFSVFELFDGFPKVAYPVVIGNIFENPELL
jgi:uncharacterized phage protein (TIGR01671 family)